MALRLVDIYRPDNEAALELPDDTYDILGHWTHAVDEKQRLDRVLLEVEETETFLDWVDGVVSSDYRVVLQSVEATLPQREVDEETEAEEDEGTEEVSVGRIGRAELYEYAWDATDVSAIYYALIALSTIVAIGGMVRDQTAVVIGAMMIAPLIGPNLALALGTTLGDMNLLGRSLWANTAGVVLAFLGALAAGVLLPVDPEIGEIAARAEIQVSDVALAAAAGSAGVLSVSRGTATGLVGVMVAVALLPPLVATGLLLGAGHFGGGGQAALLTAVNIVALNLAAVCTFLLQGVRPRAWHEVEQARTSTRVALVLWGIALAILLAALWFGG